MGFATPAGNRPVFEDTPRCSVIFFILATVLISELAAPVVSAFQAMLRKGESRVPLADVAAGPQRAGVGLVARHEVLGADAELGVAGRADGATRWQCAAGGGLKI